MPRTMNNQGRTAARTGNKDRVINSGQRKTVGGSIYSQKPDAPSASEFREGFLRLKGDAVPDPLGVMAPAVPRKKGTNRTMGARLTISPNTHAVVPVEAAPTMANARIVPAVMGSRRNFWAEG